MKLLIFLIFTPFLLFAQTRIAVIGGGMAGVSATYHLQEYDSKAKITLFEKEPVLGGNAVTVDVPNSKGTLVKVDAGPQYFASKEWEEYQDFVGKTIGLRDTVKFESVGGSLVIYQDIAKNPLIATPLNGKFRKEKLRNLLKFKRLNEKAYELYQNADKNAGLTIEKWVETLGFDDDYKKRIVYPFLGASLGISVDEIGKMSAWTS